MSYVVIVSDSEQLFLAIMNSWILMISERYSCIRRWRFTRLELLRTKTSQNFQRKYVLNTWENATEVVAKTNYLSVITRTHLLEEKNTQSCAMTSKHGLQTNKK